MIILIYNLSKYNKSLLVLLFFLILLSHVNSQTAHCLWVQGFGGTNEDISNDLAVDHDGNFYLSGGFASSSLIIGNNTLINSGSTDVFVAKLDTSGLPQWARQAVGSGYDHCNAICVDQLGNVYIAGYFRSGTLNFNNKIINNVGGEDIFVAKYDNYGKVQWAKAFGGYGNDRCYRIEAGPAGNIYFTGIFNSSSIYFDEFQLINYADGYNDLYIVRIDQDADVIWAVRAGRELNDESSRLAVDLEENIYISGSFNSTSINFGSHTLTNYGSYDIFLAKYNSTGNALWAKNARGNGSDYGHSLTVDKYGNIYQTGYFQSLNLYFDSFLLHNNGNTDIFVTKYNTNSNVLWSKSFGGGGSDYGYGIGVNADEEICLTGKFSNQVLFGNYSLMSSGQGDLFVVKLNSSSQVVNVLKVGGEKDDFGAAVKFLSENSIVARGNFKSYFVTIGDTILYNHNQNYNDFFLSALCFAPEALFSYVLENNTVYLENQSVNAVYWYWDFGDGEYSSLENPVHTYNEDGTYVITLISYNDCSSDTYNQTINICTNPVAEFNFVADYLTIHFENYSSFADSYFWDFGDGYYSSLENPEHAYEEEGYYEVALIAYNECGNDTILKSVYVFMMPLANFIWSADELDVTFTNLSLNSNAWEWDLGDGCSSAMEHPAHHYPHNGYYYVTLTASNAHGSSSYSDFVYVCIPPHAEFRYTHLDLEVDFVNMSDYEESCYWDFGDGEASYGCNPDHTYADEGDYLVVLVASNECGSDLYSMTVHLELDDYHDIRIFPNPNRGKMMVNIINYKRQLIAMDVYDARGRLIFRPQYLPDSYNYLSPLDMSQYTPGMYFFRITNFEFTTVKKVVIY